MTRGSVPEGDSETVIEGVVEVLEETLSESVFVSDDDKLRLCEVLENPVLVCNVQNEDEALRDSEGVSIALVELVGDVLNVPILVEDGEPKGVVEALEDSDFVLVSERVIEALVEPLLVLEESEALKD